MKLFLFGWMALVGLTAFGSEKVLSSCRDVHFSPTEKDKLELELLRSAEHSDDAVIRAYRGSFQARMAEFSYNPYTKWSCFNEGRDLIEAAVRQAPNNPEVRFIRLSVQLKAPSFLGYNSDIQSDLRTVTDALLNGWLADEQAFRNRVVDFLVQNGDLNPSIQQKIIPLKTAQ